MKAIRLKQKQRERRARHVRAKLGGTRTRPRLSVHRSLKHISAQLIDDDSGQTLAAVSSTAKQIAGDLQGKNKTERARVIGAEIARKAKDIGVESAIFDRGFRKYHGRLKALADAAREGGLRF